MKNSIACHCIAASILHSLFNCISASFGQFLLRFSLRSFCCSPKRQVTIYRPWAIRRGGRYPSDPFSHKRKSRRRSPPDFLIRVLLRFTRSEEVPDGNQARKSLCRQFRFDVRERQIQHSGKIWFCQCFGCPLVCLTKSLPCWEWIIGECRGNARKIIK